ncbi:MAG: M28 family peptidase [Lachnospiraceae bacterium]
MKKRELFGLLMGMLLVAPAACAKNQGAVSDGTVTVSEKPQEVTEVPVTPAGETPGDIILAELAADLEHLTKQPRPIGSEGEKEAVRYLQERFTRMGYTVSLQTYETAEGKTGSNVIAKKEASEEAADILVISAHHDSVPTAYGANDNASGVAALLAVADAVKNLPTDTELRFISFTDEENGKNGSRQYTESLSEEERQRIIGDLQLDMLGGLGSEGMALSTTDGESNWLCDLLREQDSTLEVLTETASDHASFQLAGIPAVLLMQKGRGYLYHSVADTASQIDQEAVAQAAKLAAEAVSRVMSKESASYQSLAREQGNGYTYRQRRQNVIYFDSSLKDSEAYIGAAGELVEHKEETWGQWTDVYDTYRYSMRWFDGEVPMQTDYCYRNGFLQNIKIYPTETGYTTEEVRQLLYAMYGEPDTANSDADGNRKENWTDTIYSKYITLEDGKESCTVTVSKYSVGITNVLAAYAVEDGEIQTDDLRHERVWDYVCSVLPKQALEKITQFNLFTDGFSNVLAYTSPVRLEDRSDNTQFSVNIDYYDVYDENGSVRDLSKLTYTILHEYGHVLLEDETQVDLSVGTGTHDPAGYIEGSFRRKFYDRFWKEIGDSGVNDYEEHPTNYVSRYGANYFHEDIADTFAVFVLGGKPEGSSVAEEKLMFFWDDADMVSLREAIRTLLELTDF